MKQSKKRSRNFPKIKPQKSPNWRNPPSTQKSKIDLHQGKSWNFRIPRRKRRFYKLPENGQNKSFTKKISYYQNDLGLLSSITEKKKNTWGNAHKILKQNYFQSKVLSPSNQIWRQTKAISDMEAHKNLPSRYAFSGKPLEAELHKMRK